MHFRRLLAVIAGTLVGCVRLGLCIPALLVIVTHSIFPPLGSLDAPADDLNKSQTTRAAPEEQQSNILVLLWGFIRLFLEILCCLLTVGDTLVTTSHRSARPASPHSFLSLLGLPRWMLRALFAIVVTASYACRTLLQISERWSGSVAAVYAAMPALSLLLGVLSSFLGVLPVCTSHPWLGEAPPDSSPLAWTPHSHPERNRPAYRDLGIVQRAKVSLEIVSAVAIPCFVTAVAIFSLYRDLSLYSVCQEWQSVVKSGLHILLSLVMVGLLLYQIRTNSKVVLPAMLRFILLYLVSAALSIGDLEMLPALNYYCMHAFGIFIILVLFGTYLISKNQKHCKDDCVRCLREFFSNFKTHDKQLRCLQTCGLLSALVGFCFAVVALPLTWYRVDFLPDKIFEDFIAATEYLKQQFQILGTEIDGLSNELEPYIKIPPETFNDQLVASAFLLGLFPFLGTITSRTEKAGLLLRQVMLLDGKIILAKREVTSVLRLLDNADDVIAESRKPLLIGLTTATFGLVAFLLPLIVTGVVAMVIGFWPRRFAPELQEYSLHPYKVVRGLAILVLVFNTFGLILFETWSPQFSGLASSLPLLEATLVREPACTLIDCAFVLSIVASVVFLTYAQFALWLQNNRRDTQEDILGDDEHPGLNLGRRNTYTAFKIPSLSSLGTSDTANRRSRANTMSENKSTEGVLRLNPAPRGRYRRKMSAPLIDYDESPMVNRVRPQTPPLHPSTPPRTTPSLNESQPPRASTPPTNPLIQDVVTSHCVSSPQFSSLDDTSSPSPHIRQIANITPSPYIRTPTSTPPLRFPNAPFSPVIRMSLRRNQSSPALSDKPPLAPKPIFIRTASPIVTLPSSNPDSSHLSRSRDSFSSDDDMSASSQQLKGGSPDFSFTRVAFDKTIETSNWSLSESSLVSSRVSDRPVGLASRMDSSFSPVRNFPAKVRKRHKGHEPTTNSVRPTSEEARLNSVQPNVSKSPVSPFRPSFQRSSRSSGFDQKTRKRISNQRSSRGQDSFFSVGRVAASNGHIERIPPRGWCLGLVLTAVAMLLAFQSMSQEWVSFRHVLKSKWASLIIQMTDQLKVLEKLVFLVFKYKNDFVGPLPSIADLKQVVPVIFVNEFNQTTVNLINILENDPSFNIRENAQMNSFQFTLQYTLILEFLIPTFLSFLLVFVGFMVSFSHRASSYFPAHELKAWLKRLSLFVILNSCNTVFVMLRQLQSDNLPIFNLQVTIRSGFAFGVASQCLVLLVAVVLGIEMICPPDYGTDIIPEDNESVSTLDLDNIQTPTHLGPLQMQRTTRL